MAEQRLTIEDFTGGLGTIGEKRDKRGSAHFMRGTNPYENASYLITAKQGTKISSTTVVNLPHWLDDASPWNTNRYVYDEGGNIYQLTSSDVVTNIKTVSSSKGNGFKVFNNNLYYAGNTSLGKYGLLDGTPAFTDDFLKTTSPITPGADAFDKDPGSNASGGGTGFTYTTPLTGATPSEAAADRLLFKPTKDPIRVLQVNIGTKGTGDWTVKLHDATNTLIASITITNASLANGQFFFAFSPYARIIRNNQYHFHITSTVADGTLVTNTAASIVGAQFTTFFNVLIDADWHPMVTLEDMVIVGNERYLATWNEATYDPCTITFDPGFEVRALAKFEEFIVISVYKGGTVDKAEDALIYIWDGISPSFNSSIPSTIGLGQAIHNSKNKLIGVYGDKGAVYIGSDPFTRVTNQTPLLQASKRIEVYPGAITEYEGRTLIGMGAYTDDTTNVQIGVYEYGQEVDETQTSFNFPYVISTNHYQGTNLKIGMVKAIGTDLYIGWRDNTSYGIDKITKSSNSIGGSLWESLLFDNGNHDKTKLAKDLVMSFTPLVTGQSVVLKYKTDREANWNVAAVETTVGVDRMEMGIFHRFHELEIGFEIVSAASAFLKVYGVLLVYDDLKEERVSD